MKSSIWVVLLLLLGTASHTIAQENFEELADMLESAESREKLEKKHLYIHNYPPQKFPKAYGINDAFKFDRIGIFSIAMLDEQKLLNGSGETVYWNTGATLSDLLGKVYDPALTKIKEQAAAAGKEVLTPSEYLTTPELKQAYRDLKIQNSAFAKVAAAVGSAFGSKHGAVAAPEGYRVFPPLIMSGQVTDKESEYRIGALAQQAGLDAMLVIVIHVTANHDKFGKPVAVLYDFKSDIHLTNQNPQDPNKKYPKIMGGYPASVKLGYSQMIRPDMVVNPREKVKVDGKKKLIEHDYSNAMSRVFVAFFEAHLRTAQAIVNRTNDKNKLN